MKHTAVEKHYYCPGETHPISRSVHLARMAEFYPKCRECPFNSDTGQLSKNIVQQLKSSQRRKIEPVLFREENIRGIYLNEFNRPLASQLTIAFAQLLWEHVATADITNSTNQQPVADSDNLNSQVRKRPNVVVGYDERLSSPDIYAGVIMGLRKMGCQIIDIGLSTAPCFRFAIEHLDASGGLYITGAGSAPSWSGLDIVLSHAQPIPASSDNPHEITLSAIEQCLHLPTNRPTRQAGAQRHFHAIGPYEASFQNHFHALRPLKICCATDSGLLKKTIHRLSTDLPCTLIFTEIPQRSRDVTDPQDNDVKRLQQAVTQHSAHLGILIDSDASRCCLVDDKGVYVSATQLLQLLAVDYLEEQPSCVLAIPDQLRNEVTEFETQTGINCVHAENSTTELLRSMRNHAADIGISTDGRYWLGTPVPVCDAVLVLGKVLQALSRSDTLFSDLLSHYKTVEG